MRTLFAALATSLALLAAPTQAATLHGMTNDQGYQLIQFQVQQPQSLVDMRFLGGFQDASLLLFDAQGQHLITGDDIDLPVFTADPRLTQTLGAGDYTLMVTGCCFWNQVLAPAGALHQDSDGHNSGSFFVGGGATLGQVLDYYENFEANTGFAPQERNLAYQLSITGLDAANRVPEPGSLALLGAALLGLRLRRGFRAIG